METTNSNFLYQLDAQITADLSRDIGLATMVFKMKQKEALTDIEKFSMWPYRNDILPYWKSHGPSTKADPYPASIGMTGKSICLTM
ncbi:MAG: hypothetical protein HOI35_12630 [Woeseia sp.]|jgi:hypothetical protein|nr:hypothetical protein [Woeseia sp.]MBT6210849.1 hypothetical protein [Woeseia sp.]